MKNYLIDFYLQFTNDFLTVESFAEYNGITEKECKYLINAGKKYFNNQKF